MTWKMFMDAYSWDRKTNHLRVHQKLTNDHVFLNSSLMMRNKLAEDVLGTFNIAYPQYT